MGSSDDERPSIHDRFNDDRRSHSSPKDFFRALGHSSKASGLGRRVYEQADKGSRHATEEYKDTTPWNGQVGERRQVSSAPLVHTAFADAHWTPSDNNSTKPALRPLKSRRQTLCQTS